jgi:hypothetical protein
VHTVGEYKGRPVITLKRDAEDRYGFSFGLGKAKLILDNLEAISDFCVANKDKAGKRG